MPKKPHKLKDLIINELSLVTRGANQKANIVLFKQHSENNDNIKSEKNLNLNEGLNMSLEKILEEVTKALSPVVAKVEDLSQKVDTLKAAKPEVEPEDKKEDKNSKMKPEKKSEDVAEVDETLAKQAQEVEEMKKSLAETLSDLKKQAEDLQKQADELKLEKQLLAIQKQIETEYPYLPGTQEQKVDLFKRLSEDEFGKSVLKQLSDKNQGLMKTYGHSVPGAAGSEDPQAKLDQLSKAYADEHKVSLAKAEAAVLETNEGRKLYKELVEGNQ